MLAINNMKFVEDIEELCQSKNLQYIDAVIYWCERNNLEVEYAADIIKKDAAMKSKLQYEAENLNVLKKSARLPI